MQGTCIRIQVHHLCTRPIPVPHWYSVGTHGVEINSMYQDLVHPPYRVSNQYWYVWHAQYRSVHTSTANHDQNKCTRSDKKNKPEHMATMANFKHTRYQEFQYLNSEILGSHKQAAQGLKIQVSGWLKNNSSSSSQLIEKQNM